MVVAHRAVSGVVSLIDPLPWRLWTEFRAARWRAKRRRHSELRANITRRSPGPGCNSSGHASHTRDALAAVTVERPRLLKLLQVLHGKQLVPAGHEVVGMTSKESNRILIDTLGATPVVADALDPDQVA